MRFNPVPLMSVLLLYSYAGSSKVVSYLKENYRYRLSLNSWSFIPSKNISDTSIEVLNSTAMRPGRKTFLVIQFEKIPAESEKQLLKLNGIELLDYIPNYAYTAIVSGSLNIG